MKKAIFGLLATALIIAFAGCGSGDVNPIPDKHFTNDGELKKEFAPDSAVLQCKPSAVKFFIEVSGSMNGLYRAGMKTEFRDDVYQIASRFLTDNEKVYALASNDGKSGFELSLNQFAQAIRAQGFPTMGTTSIVDMIETVISNVDTTRNEVGILVSDMKFDPDGGNNIGYQLGMYTTKIAHITAESDMAFSLVGAKSKYYDAQGNLAAEESPYYYLVIGKSENVAKVRDEISSILFMNKTFIDNIETGMNYGGVGFSLKKERNCLKNDKQPTFTGVNESSPCKIKLELFLHNYRWCQMDSAAVAESFSAKTLHGGKLKVEGIKMDTTLINDKKQLQRMAKATISLSISHMPNPCDVIEWSYNPCKFESSTYGFTPYLGARDWREFHKTFSLEYFLKGFFRDANLNKCSTKPNYILISKN